MSELIRVRVKNGYGTESLVGDDGKTVRMPKVFTFKHDGMNIKCEKKITREGGGHGEPEFAGSELVFTVDGERIYAQGPFYIQTSQAEIAKIKPYF